MPQIQALDPLTDKDPVPRVVPCLPEENSRRVKVKFCNAEVSANE